MFYSILKSALRLIKKNKFNSIISVIGLTAGFFTFILINLFISYEVSWDSYQKNYDRIYRIQTYKTINDERLMQTSPALFDFLKDKFEAIEDNCLVLPNQKEYISVSPDNQSVYKEGLYANQGYLEIFSFDFLHGSKVNTLDEPFSVALSSSLSTLLFDNKNPVGETVFLRKKHPLKVTGVFKDLPLNSHLRPAFIISFNSLEVLWNRDDLYDNWDWNAFYNYVLLEDGAESKTVDAALKDILKDKVKTDYRQLYLKPLSSLYMYSTNDNYTRIIKILSLFGFFVLVLASINYMNLSIAASASRYKEIGIKKVIGSGRRLLVLQISIEIFVLIILSIILSLVLIEISLPRINTHLDKDISLSILFQAGIFVKIFLIILIISGLSSLYPGFLIISVRSVDLFKNNPQTFRTSGFPMKRILVGFQFMISIILISLTILLTKQIRYTYQKDIGFEKSNLLFTEIETSAEGITLARIKNRLKDISYIENVSASRGFPIHSSKNTNSRMINREGGAREERTGIRQFWVSQEFVSTMGLNIVKGRDFSKKFTGDSEGRCIINETAMRHFGWEDPIGKSLDDRNLNVIGVVRDFHFHDMYNTIQPIVMTLHPDDKILEGPVFIAFRVLPGSTVDSKNQISETLNEFFPNDPFEVKIFTDHFKTAEIFKTYETFHSIFLFCAVVAIILAILGVFGLVTHSLHKKTKEIAIRKISGCSSFRIFRSVIVEYILLIIIASVFGSLAAAYVFDLMPINYRTDQNIMDFMTAIILTLLITILSIGYKTWKESVRNPVDSLRYE